MALIFLYGINRVIGLRVSLVEEIIGADIVEHGIGESDELIALVTKPFID